MWSFQGKMVQQHNMERFCQLLWRPRPPTLLTADQIKEIRKNLKKYSAQFEVKDRMALTKASKASALICFCILVLKICLGFRLMSFFSGKKQKKPIGTY